MEYLKAYPMVWNFLFGLVTIKTYKRYFTLYLSKQRNFTLIFLILVGTCIVSFPRSGWILLFLPFLTWARGFSNVLIFSLKGIYLVYFMYENKKGQINIS